MDMAKYRFNTEDFIRDYNDGMSLDDMQTKYGYKNKTGLFPTIKNLGLQPKLNRWTKEKLSYLKENYGNASWEDLLQNLSPFKKGDITTKACKLNLKREHFNYSLEEVEILKKYYGSVTFEEIKALLPHRSDTSIMCKANSLGLTMREKWTKEEDEKLILLYPHNTNEELLFYFPNRTITSIQSRATMFLKLAKDREFQNQKYREQTRVKLLNDLKGFAVELGRTPTSEEINLKEGIAGHNSFHRYFGSYANACAEAGLEVNVSIFGKSYHYTSEDGSRCLSSKELEITNILIHSDINFEKEVLYRDILSKDDLRMIRCDWLINSDVIVEYFGMPEKEYYRERMDEKINLCIDHNAKLISLLPEDLKNNYKGMKNKFMEFNIDLSIPICQ